jgi:hypothetical protein
MFMAALYVPMAHWVTLDQNIHQGQSSLQHGACLQWDCGVLGPGSPRGQGAKASPGQDCGVVPHGAPMLTGMTLEQASRDGFCRALHGKDLLQNLTSSNCTQEDVLGRGWHILHDPGPGCHHEPSEPPGPELHWHLPPCLDLQSAKKPLPHLCIAVLRQNVTCSPTNTTSWKL